MAWSLVHSTAGNQFNFNFELQLCRHLPKFTCFVIRPSRDGVDRRPCLASRTLQEEVELICQKDLPSDKMRCIRQGWSILARELGDLLTHWLTEAVWNERRRKTPEQFQFATKVNLSDEDLNSETNRVLGWAVKSCCDEIADPKSPDFHLLEQMICLEKDASE